MKLNGEKSKREKKVEGKENGSLVWVRRNKKNV
jgi:hypothetical protein